MAACKMFRYVSKKSSEPIYGFVVDLLWVAEGVSHLLAPYFFGGLLVMPKRGNGGSSLFWSPHMPNIILKIVALHFSRK